MHDFKKEELNSHHKAHAMGVSRMLDEATYIEWLDDYFTALPDNEKKYKMNALMKACEAEGIYLIITEGFRTKEYQDSLYAKGRTKPGSIVTNAKGSDYASQHQWGIAFDVAINDSKKLYDVNLLCRVGAIAKGRKIGLGWGGDWTSPVDRPHFYLKSWGSTPFGLKQKYKTPEAFAKTWTATVSRTGGLYIRGKKPHKQKIKKLAYGTKIQVFWKHKTWTRMKYGDTVGYMMSKYLK